MEVLLTSAAQKDLTLVIAWYEGQQLGLGAEFLRCFDAALMPLCFGPGIPCHWHCN